MPAERLPPGPPAAFDLESGDDKLQRMQALWRQYGDCYRVRAVSRPADTWVIIDPELARRILVSNHRNYQKGVGIERIRVLLGNGLMTSEGEQWRRQRRLLQAAFHKPRVQGYCGIFLRQAEQLADRCLQAARAGQPVNITAAVSETTLLAVLEALFSEDLPRFDDAQGRSLFRLVSEDSRRDLQFAARFRALAAPIQQVMDARRREQRFPPDLLSHCLLARDKQRGEPMPDRQIVDEVLTQVVAGHETTAASLNWVWYLLATHPQHYDVLHQALQAVDTDSLADRLPGDALQPVVRVISEALRLYPPGWLYTRRALDDDELGDYQLPAGTDVFINSWLLHRHPRYWDQPERFDPQRFTPENAARRHRYAYLPFSAGPRHCIGESFAMAEMSIHLAVMAKRLRPRPVAPGSVALQADVNLRPRDPLYLYLEAAGDAHG